MIEMLDSFHMVAVDQTVLDRATEPFPTLLGMLDAIHLATALLVRDAFDDLTLATNDGELALAARAVGFPVLGAAGG